MKKAFIIFVIFLCCLLSYSIPVIAWNPGKHFSVEIIYSEVPENAVMLDMLVRKSDIKNNFSDFQTQNGELFGIKATSEIANYDIADYVSYSFHYKDSESQMIINQYLSYDFAYCYFGNENTYDTDNYQEKIKMLDDIRMVKFAYLNAEGEILAVKNEFKTHSLIPIFLRSFCQISGVNLEIIFEAGPPLWMLGLIPIGIIIAIIIQCFKGFKKKLLRREKQYDKKD